MRSRTQRSQVGLAVPRRVIGRRRWLVALVGGAVAAASVAPSATAVQQPSKVIDAQDDPQAAGDALNSGCAGATIVGGTSPGSSQCSWNPTTKITIGYGPPKILGDALYNCANPLDPDAYAEESVEFTDEREQSIGISETVSVEVGLGFLGFEKTTAEFEAFSKQVGSFSTSVSTTHAVAVPPWWKGWTETKMLTASVTGDAYISVPSGPDAGLLQVKDIDLNFPGYTPENSKDDPILRIGYRTPMVFADLQSRCADIADFGIEAAALQPARPRALAPRAFGITFCRATCATRKVVGIRPPRITRGSAILTRRGRTYATGTHIRGHHRLKPRRTIRPGEYKLRVIQRIRPSRQERRRRLRTELHSVVPLTVR
jgi:hypothetical protein